jgi:lysine 2,3-aminomutase
MRKYYPHAKARDWNNWKWQLQNRIHTVEDISRIITLTTEEKYFFENNQNSLPFGITPYYASLLEDTPTHPIRKAIIPTFHEQIISRGEESDPLHEDHDSPVPGIVHRYPDRVLFLTTSYCSVICRYCTRARIFQKPECSSSKARWEKAIRYIETTPTIRDVLLSGGDPLTLSDENLDWLLTRLRQIKHVEIIRIGTKVPAVLPQRIDRNLVKILKKHHPLMMSIHCMHPLEVTPEMSAACKRLADAGIPLGSQTVLLKGINDSVETLKSLMHKLLVIRVKPYYLYQCDPIVGSQHFRTSIETGLDIIKGLRGHTSGYAVPTYVIDAPGGGGKIPLQPDYYQGRQDDYVILKNYENKTFAYYDPDPASERGGFDS